MKTTRGRSGGDRYAFDFGSRSTTEGWAQFDTRQDASYFGNWVDPTGLRAFTFAEGDTTMVECADEAEFAAHVESMAAFYKGFDGGAPTIDPGVGPAAAAIVARFEAMGLGRLIPDCARAQSV